MQSRERTVGQVIADSDTYCNWRTDVCKTITGFYVVGTNGDGTVPLLSARRFGNGINLNASFNYPQNPHYFIVQSKNEDQDATADHNGLTQNPVVQNAVLSLLRPDSQNNSANSEFKTERKEFKIVNAKYTTTSKAKLFNEKNSGRVNAKFMSGMQTPGDATLSPDIEGTISLQHDPSYYIKLVGVSQVSITDAYGNSVTIGNGTLTPSLPGVDVYPVGDGALQIITTTSKEYSIAFRNNDDVASITILKGENNLNPTQIIRYTDVSLPTGVMTMLKLTPQGVENLRYDGDKDGVFETSVSPTVLVSGSAARDVTAPIVSISSTVQQGQTIVGITAADAESGVKQIRYSLDGTHFQTYSAPLVVDACKIRTIHAFADDNVENRSGVATYQLQNLPPDVSRAQPSVASIFPANHKLVAVSVRGVTDPDCDSVTIRIDRIMQDEPTNGTGDGDTCSDAAGVGTSTARLRAERSGNGNGRVYTIYFTATDSHGASSQGSVKVGVPKNAKDAAVDDGAKFDSTTCP